jgi:hypothetical protein
MKLRFSASNLALVLMAVCSTCAMQAHAQVGLYFNPIVSRVSNSTADTGPFAFLGQGSTSRIFGGVDLGGYYTFFKGPMFDASVDARDEIQHGNNASLNSFLVGPRVAFQPVGFGVRPYVQLSIGEGRTASPESPAHTTKLEYAIFGGIDKPLGKHVDFRVVEVGYGSVTTVSSAIYGGTTPIPAARLLNFSTGFVFKIP